MKVGDAVVWVNAVGEQKPALVTTVWGTGDMPCCINLITVSSDSDRTDQYGRQIERFTSVPYRTQQGAHGYYWMNAGETPNPYVEPQR